ncbi:MAG: LamG-like jellyroll fold domain-containing protein, partial [Phycisphaerales bacterium]
MASDWLRYPNSGAGSPPGVLGRPVLLSRGRGAFFYLDDGGAAVAVATEEFFGPQDAGTTGTATIPLPVLSIAAEGSQPIITGDAVIPLAAPGVAASGSPVIVQKFGSGAVAFDADADALRGTNVPSAIESYTVSGWFKPAAINEGRIFRLQDSTGGNHTLSINTSGRVVLIDNFGTSSPAGAALQNDRWYFVAITVDAGLVQKAWVRELGASVWWGTVTKAGY